MAIDTTQPPFSENTLDFLIKAGELLYRQVTLGHLVKEILQLKHVDLQSELSRILLISKTIEQSLEVCQGNRGNQFLFYVTDSGKTSILERKKISRWWIIIKRYMASCCFKFVEI